MGFFATEQLLEDTSLDVLPNPHTPYRGLRVSGRRYYNPELGRWPSRDPIGEEAFFVQYAQGRPLAEVILLADQYFGPSYLFVQNSPILHIDPFGLAPVAGGCNEEQKKLLRELLGMSDEEAKKCDEESQEMCDGLSDAMKDMMIAPISPGGGKVKKGLVWLIKKAVGKVWKKTDPGEKFPKKPPECEEDKCKYEKK